MLLDGDALINNVFLAGELPFLYGTLIDETSLYLNLRLPILYFRINRLHFPKIARSHCSACYFHC